MEFNKLKGFWKTKSEKNDDISGGKSEKNLLSPFAETKMLFDENLSSEQVRNKLTYSKKTSREIMEPLEEIQPEVTPEGFGLKTPYGTHLDLDFMKYCETLKTDHKLKRSYSLRKTRPQMTSTPDLQRNKLTNSQTRLNSRASNEELNSTNRGDSTVEVGQPLNKAANSLMETRRRLEAFRSFRTKGSRPTPDRYVRTTVKVEKNKLANGENTGNTEDVENICVNGHTNISARELQLVRTQMSKALHRIKELEEQLKETTTLKKKLFNIEEERNKLATEIKQTKTKNNVIKAEIQNKQEVSMNSNQSNIAFDTVRRNNSDSSEPVFVYNSPRPVHFKELRPLPNIPCDSPPPTPKRKYRSVGVGDNSPMSNPCCHCGKKRTFTDVASHCVLVSEQPSKFDFSSSVKGFEIDEALGVPPLPPKKTNLSASCSLPIDRDVTSQTAPLLNHNLREVVDKSSGTCVVSHHDISVMTDRLVMLDQFTSSHDFVQFGKTKDAATSIEKECVSIATSCDGLILHKNASSGGDSQVIYKDTEAQTDSPSTNNMAVHCLVENDHNKTFADKITMTLELGDMSSVTGTHGLNPREDGSRVPSQDASLSIHEDDADDDALIKLPLDVNSEKLNLGEVFDSGKISNPPENTPNQTEPDIKHIVGSKYVIEELQTNDHYSNYSQTNGILSSTKTSNLKYNETTQNKTDENVIKPKLSSEEINLCEHLLTSQHYEESKPCSTEKLKSIMKKPGTPQRMKKFLRFADGSDSDDFSNDDSSTSSTSSVETEAEVIKIFLNNSNSKNISSESGNSLNEKLRKEEIILATLPSTDESNGTSLDDLILFDNLVVDAEKSAKLNDKKTMDLKILATNSQVVEKSSDFDKSNLSNDEISKAREILKTHCFEDDVINTEMITLASITVQKEWFRASAQPDSSVQDLDEFLSNFSDCSSKIVSKVVNMIDLNGNTVLHYAISHENFAVIDRLLSLNKLDVNRTNLAGYTPAMLAALCNVQQESNYKIFEKLFKKSNVNEHAREAGQTALMLAASNGRAKTVELLLQCNAEINATDFDGSTALMCAAEHGKLDVIKILLGNPNCDTSIVDSDGCTALKIALETNHKEVAVLLYAHMNFFPTTKSRKKRSYITDMKFA